MYKSIFAGLITAASGQGLNDLVPDGDVGDFVPTGLDDMVPSNFLDEAIGDLVPVDIPNIDISDISFPEWSEDIWETIMALNPNMLICNDTDQWFCEQLDWTSCNTDWGFCGVPCNTSADCAIENTTGTGFSVCDNSTYNSTGTGWCTQNIDGDCTTDDDCPSIIGYTCDLNMTGDYNFSIAGNFGNCKQPISCDDDYDCDEMPDGLKQCNMDTYVCGPEFCSNSTDCITEGYVCQSGLMCVPDCNDWGCEDLGNGTLACGADGLCYQVDMCDDDSDCSGMTNKCFMNFSEIIDDVSGGFPVTLPAVTNNVCGNECTTDEDCEDLDIPWASCFMNTSCISTPDKDLLFNETDMMTSCDSDDDCPAMAPYCIDSGIDEFGGMCVPDSVSLIPSWVPDDIWNISQLTQCTTADDCTDEAFPVCLNETSDVDMVETGVCVPACETDSDCDDMGMEGSMCMDTGLPYMACVPQSACAVTGHTDDCGDDEICVWGMCMGICNDDDDCSGNTECEDFTQDIPIVGKVTLFSFCNVFTGTDTDTDEPTSSPVTESPTLDPTTVVVEESTEEVGDDVEDSAFQATVLCAIAVTVTSLMF